MSSASIITFGDAPLHWQDVVAVARHGARLELSPAAWAHIDNARGIVERIAEQRVAADRLDLDQHRMTARDEQRDERRLRRIGFEQRRQEMTFHVMDADRRQIERPGE